MHDLLHLHVVGHLPAVVHAWAPWRDGGREGGREGGGRATSVNHVEVNQKGRREEGRKGGREGRREEGRKHTSLQVAGAGKMARTAGDKGERDCPPEEGASSLDVGTVDEGEGEEEGGEGGGEEGEEGGEEVVVPHVHVLRGREGGREERKEGGREGRREETHKRGG